MGTSLDKFTTEDGRELEPGSPEEFEWMMRHSEKLNLGSATPLKGRRVDPFLSVRLDGLAELGAAGLRLPAVLVALEAVRFYVSTGKPLRLTAGLRDRLRLTRHTVAAARRQLAASPQWFKVEGHSPIRATRILPTRAVVRLLHRDTRSN